jgi:hypothetical protein
MYDPDTGTFASAGMITTGRVGHVAVPLDWRRLLFVGGTYAGLGGGTTDVYDMSSATWEVGPPTAVDHGSYLGAATAFSSDGSLAVCGCWYYLVIGGLGPWTGAYSLTGEVEGGWGGCGC